MTIGTNATLELAAMPVEIATAGVRAVRPCARLRAQACALLKLCRLEDYELSLLLTDDRTIRRLNRRFRGHDHATDVLAFPQIDCPFGQRFRGRRQANSGAQAGCVPPMLGDIVISMDTARRQARELGVGLLPRLCALFIHGFLHLQGYDHERSAREKRRMLRRERDLQRRLDRMDSSPRRVARPR